MTVTINESVALAASTSPSGRLRIKIIDAGQGSSGTYPAATIKAAVEAGLFSKGLHMYADHPGGTEAMDRPERTIRDLAAVLDSDAEYVESEKAAYAEAKVFPNWREVITEMANDIGVSIRGTAEVDDSGNSRTITKLVTVESVDFVTKAGRGGKIAEVLESYRPAAQVLEATANDTREMLQRAVAAASGDDYGYVVDFDDGTVWYASYTAEDTRKLYQRAYTVTDNAAALTGTAVEVRIQTSYVPVATAAAEAAPASTPPNPAGATQNGKGPTVATTNIEESALADLTAKASRVAALESDNRKLQEALVLADATTVVAEAFEGINAPKTMARLAKAAPTKEDGTLDRDALLADAREAAAEWKLAQGEGTVRGVGDTTPTAMQESAAPAAAAPTNEDILSILKGA